jgi:antiviral helicase SKI2
MILGQPTKLQSQFRLTYNMILNLLRVEALKVEEMIKRSFSEHATQSLLPDQEKRIAVEEESLNKLEKKACSYCDVDLGIVHEACMDYLTLTQDMLNRAVMTATGKRLLSPGRIVIIHKVQNTRTPAVIMGSGLNAAFNVVKLAFANNEKLPSTDKE